MSLKKRRLFNIKLGREVRKMREALNISQKELADVLEIKQGTLSKAESGRLSLSAAQVCLLCIFFEYDFFREVKPEATEYVRSRVASYARSRAGSASE